MLQSLSANADRLKFPDFVIGFKLTKTRPAVLAKLLDGALQVAGKQLPPPLQGRLKKTSINGGDVHSLTLDGSLVPWEMVPFAQLEDQPGQLDKLRKRLKEMKLTISLSVRENYLLFSVGEGTGGLQALGGPGPKLMDQKEFAPLAKFGDRPLTSIAYVSKEYQTSGSGLKDDDSVKWLDTLIKDSKLTQVQQAKVRKDFRNLLADVRRYTPEPGAQLDFTFLTNRGYEGYHHDWTKYPGLDSSKPLTILEHVGGQPIGFFVSRSGSQEQGYADLVKYIKLMHGYFEEYGVPEMPPMEREMYRTVMKQAMPYLVRFDKATGKMLLPSVDGQGGWVLDAKLKIKLPEVPRIMPVPELAIVMGLSDADLFRQGMTEFRDTFNGLVDVLTKLAPPGEDIPNFKIPLPKTTKKAGVSLYSWPLPVHPDLDAKIMPTGGMTDKVAVFAASPEHAIRLLAKTPFKADGGPLANLKKPMSSAAHFNWAGMIDAATPWVDLALTESRQEREVVSQVHTILEVLKCFRGYSSATYQEQGAVVTHNESVFRDLK